MPRDPKNVSPGSESAEQTAVAILAWLASEPEMLSRFLALTGLEAGQLRGAVEDPGFLGGVIDFLMGHEPSLMAFCEATDTRPEAVGSAWRFYSGPGLDSGEY
ncbi:MAG: DUF3572 domain-containing protein [Pseudorhizobium sp.]